MPDETEAHCYELSMFYKFLMLYVILHISVLLVMSVVSGSFLGVLMIAAIVVWGAWLGQMVPVGPICVKKYGLKVGTTWGVRRIEWAQIRSLDDLSRFAIKRQIVLRMHGSLFSPRTRFSLNEFAIEDFDGLLQDIAQHRSDLQIVEIRRLDYW